MYHTVKGILMRLSPLNSLTSLRFRAFSSSLSVTFQCSANIPTLENVSNHRKIRLESV